MGMPPEDARFVLPIGTKVDMVMSMNARMLMHVADMRAAADAQWEIRQMTENILDFASEWCPITVEHYNEEMKNRKNRPAPEPRSQPSTSPIARSRRRPVIWMPWWSVRRMTRLA